MVEMQEYASLLASIRWVPAELPEDHLQCSSECSLLSRTRRCVQRRVVWSSVYRTLPEVPLDAVQDLGILVCSLGCTLLLISQHQLYLGQIMVSMAFRPLGKTPSVRYKTPIPCFGLGISIVLLFHSLISGFVTLWHHGPVTRDSGRPFDGTVCSNRPDLSDTVLWYAPTSFLPSLNI